MGSLTKPEKSADVSSVGSGDLLGVIRVTYDSEVLGSGVFWEGRADDIKEMRNIPARMLATRVAKHGGKEQLGMWTAELLLPNDGVEARHD